MESESTSRSSTNDFSSVTSSGLTPATSSRISARPETISSLVISFLPVWFVRSPRAADDLTGIGQPSAEADEKHRGSGLHLATLDHFGKGHRNARGRSVA